MKNINNILRFAQGLFVQCDLFQQLNKSLYSSVQYKEAILKSAKLLAYCSSHFCLKLNKAKFFFYSLHESQYDSQIFSLPSNNFITFSFLLHCHPNLSSSTFTVTVYLTMELMYKAHKENDFIRPFSKFCFKTCPLVLSCPSYCLKTIGQRTFQTGYTRSIITYFNLKITLL